jgi:hypothetical protein
MKPTSPAIGEHAIREAAALRRALELATATVELHTGNGARSQPDWPRDPAGNVDYEQVAAICRRALGT